MIFEKDYWTVHVGARASSAKCCGNSITGLDGCDSVSDNLKFIVKAKI